MLNYTLNRNYTVIWRDIECVYFLWCRPTYIGWRSPGGMVNVSVDGSKYLKKTSKDFNKILISEIIQAYLKTSESIQNLPKLSKDSRRIQQYPKISKMQQHIQRYPAISMNMQNIRKYSKIAKDIQECPRISKSMQKYRKLSNNPRRYTNRSRGYANISRSSRKICEHSLNQPKSGDNSYSRLSRVSIGPKNLFSPRTRHRNNFRKTFWNLPKTSARVFGSFLSKISLSRLGFLTNDRNIC